MIITSSRKPSDKTRIICKYFADFFNSEYINRGKTSFDYLLDISKESPMLVIGDHHGNPGSMTIYRSGNSTYLSVYFNVRDLHTVKYTKLKSKLPVCVGSGKLSELICNFIPFEDRIFEDVPENNSRFLEVDNENMVFYDSGSIILNLAVNSFKLIDEEY
ncbi:Brix domain protein [Methanosalsum zhilinae DSM 4017]|uniref:Probable Brix domain-containing ribosomal biogenesis protein n=1 Tax=Methanosalsum zhilinae (strain DSM 4017 / NBRC 107636 / OCM 62 / WeN5) TaxID=679901 RepID=F7XMC0_METZD|nr:Brix domain-containing protein [Methanosalsum zhilinae]AEH61021.1 Brix domain protein [Methanosalsum zhilinae DSM 4017]